MEALLLKDDDDLGLGDIAAASKEATFAHGEVSRQTGSTALRPSDGSTGCVRIGARVRDVDFLGSAAGRTRGMILV